MGSVCVTDMTDASTRRLTPRSADATAPRPEACVFSSDGRKIAFVRNVPIIGNVVQPDIRVRGVISPLPLAGTTKWSEPGVRRKSRDNATHYRISARFRCGAGRRHGERLASVSFFLCHRTKMRATIRPIRPPRYPALWM